MNNHTSDAMELTQQLIQIDSSNPGAYEGEISTFIYNWLKELGVDVYKDQVLPGRFNIMGRINGIVQHPSLIYICHMDTVTIGSGWDHTPLGGDIIDGKIYGRGACDMKSGLACAMSAFSQIAKNKHTPYHSFSFIATVDEEDFMRGVQQAMAAGWITKDDWVLDMEPTNGQIQVAHKGRTWFELTVTGITAHASTPWKGADAIAAMSEIITRIRSQINSCPSHADLGFCTCTFGQITGGYRPYVVPDSCKVWIDMRLVPPTDTKKAIEILEQAIVETQSLIPGITADYLITGDRPYVEKDDSSYLLSKLQTACLQSTQEEPFVTCFPGYTDTAVIASSLNNHNCMSYGPGNLEMAHKPNEYVPCEDILRCEEVLTILATSVLYKDSE